MIKLPKTLVFFLFVLVTILLAVTFNQVDWNIINAGVNTKDIFKEVREPIIFLILAFYFIHYYVRVINEEK